MTTEATLEAPRVPPLVVLLLAVLGISTAAPLVRLSHARPLTIVVWRLGFSLLVIGVLLLPGRQWRQWVRLSRADFSLALAAGVLLACHFWGWTVSLGLTTVAASTVLVNMQPVVVGVLSALLLREPPTKRQWIGIGLAVLGAAVIARADAPTQGGAPNALLGDGLALASGVAAGGYYLVGRRLRRVLDLWPYVALVYGACFVVLLAAALVTRAPLWPEPPRELAVFAGLAIGPMLLGHTGMNWALRYLPAPVVNVTTLGEPVGATMLAAFLPWIREWPAPATLAGGAIVLAGIACTLIPVRGGSDATVEVGAL
jgi:drug/metabolite transporter (DMT)-like permease